MTESAFVMVHVYLPPEQRRQILAAQAEQMSNAEMMLRAINDTHQQLRTHFTAAATPPAGLFDTTVYQRRRRRPKRADGSEPLVQYGARLAREHLQVIDQLVSGLQGVSRSAYIAAALQMHVQGEVQSNAVPQVLEREVR